MTETWTYASPYSVTAPGDLTTKYYPGFVILVVQTTLKFFVVESVVYNNPNSTITFSTPSAYSLANAAIESFEITAIHKQYDTFKGETDVIVYQRDGTIYAKNQKTQVAIDSGVVGSEVNTRVLRAAIAGCPIGGSLFIDSGLYDGLICDQLCSVSSDPDYLHYYAALPITQNIHIRGAGMRSTVLKMADGQHSGAHPALIMYAYAPPIGDVMQDGYTSFSLEDMTFDGNKNEQTIAFYDGAGLFLDGCMRYNGVFRNLEFQNSANSACYFGNHGNGFANNCLYENIHSHDNAGISINFDTVHNSVVHGLFSDNDAGGYIGIYIMSADYQWSRENASEQDKLNSLDGLIVDGIIVHNSLLYMEGVNSSQFSNIEITDTGGTYAMGVRLYTCNDIDLVNVNIKPGRATNHNGINIHESTNIRITGGLLDSYIPIFADLGSSVILTGVTLDAAFEIFYASDASKIELMACKLLPTAEQWMGTALDTSEVQAIGCSASVLCPYYIEPTAKFTQFGCIGMGYTGCAPLQTNDLRVGLIPELTSPKTYSVAGIGNNDQGLIVAAYWLASNTYGHRRYIDIVALGYQLAGEGGSALRFLTNSGLSPTAVEAMLIDRNQHVGIGRSPADYPLEVQGDIYSTGYVRGDGSLLTGLGSPIAGGIAPAIHAATDKSALADGDEIGVTDSAATYGLKHILYSELKTLLNALYAGITHASRHVGGGADAIAVATTSVAGLESSADKTKLDGMAAGANVTATALAPAIHAATDKTTPVDADELPITDSAATYALKHLTWAHLKAALKDALFGTLSAPVIVDSICSEFYIRSAQGRLLFLNSDAINYIESVNVDESASQILYFTGKDAGAGTFNFVGKTGFGRVPTTYPLEVQGDIYSTGCVRGDGSLLTSLPIAGGIAPAIHAATQKTSIVDADELCIADSAASNILKEITALILKTYINLGVSGGRTIVGGTGASENLTLQSTSHATRGSVLIPDLAEFSQRILGGFGAKAATGTLDWNDISNSRSGSGYTLLLGTATNGPGGTSYYHPFNFEYNTKDGSGIITQFAIPYAHSASIFSNIYKRGRYGGVWSAWSMITSEDSYGDIYVTRNCSALSFTDRTDAFVGDALAEIAKIKADRKGKINHDTLPDFARHVKTEKMEDGSIKKVSERNIGNMVSVLTTAIQQLTKQNETLVARIAALEEHK